MTMAGPRGGTAAPGGGSWPQQTRVARLRGTISASGLDAYLVQDPRNIRYLTGFTGTAARLVASPDATVFITDFRYAEQSRAQVRGSEVVIAPGEYDEAVAETVRKFGAGSLGLPAGEVTLAVRDRLAALLEGVSLRASPDLVGPLRRIKDAGEIEAIERAVDLASRVFDSILEEVRPGVVERDLALEIEFRMRREGAEAAAFETIVASGWRSSFPHGVASDKKMEAGELVTVDMGARLNGYHSDMTRTVSIGDPGEDGRRIYDLVRRAQEHCAHGVEPGMHGRQADALARGLIEQEGYGRYFGHGTGHGIGLDVHEGPKIGPRSGEQDVLVSGAVYTVEPGVYIPGLGGVRIEDCVVMEDEGPRVLTSNTRDLLVL